LSFTVRRSPIRDPSSGFTTGEQITPDSIGYA
jgi:hypothetical protein